jgi:outer membrane protein TolC
MTKQKILNFAACLMLSVSVMRSQGTTTQSADFSLQAAVDYAIKHNPAYLNAELDIRMAKYKKNEVLGLGLPQINASVDVKDYFEIPTSLLPGEFFGAPPGTFIPVKFGTQYNALAGVSVSQLIFSSDYIVGLKASKELMILSERNVSRTKMETVVAVTKAYYTVLINKERIKTLDANIERVKKLFDDTKALNQSGFVEKIDADRIELTYNNLVTEREKVGRLVGITETLLKFQMGYDVKQPINLTDELKAEQLVDIELAQDLKVNYDARVEFSLLQSQLKLNNLELKRYKYQFLPTLVAYGSYNQQAQRTKFDFFDTSQKWYPIGIFGATLSLPIVTGGQRYFRIQQAKVNLEKTNNSINQLKSVIEMETSSNSIIYKNAYTSMLVQKKNKELAQSIYETVKKKYEAGVGSNLEVVTAETALKESETNYLNAVFDLIMAKTDLDKALGNIK